MSTVSASARKNLGRARTRAQEVGEFVLGVAQFVYGVTKHIDRIEALVAVDRPPPRLIALDQCDQYIALIALFAPLRGTPTGVDRGKRRA